MPAESGSDGPGLGPRWSGGPYPGWKPPGNADERGLVEVRAAGFFRVALPAEILCGGGYERRLMAQIGQRIFLSHRHHLALFFAFALEKQDTTSMLQRRQDPGEHSSHTFAVLPIWCRRRRGRERPARRARQTEPPPEMFLKAQAARSSHSPLHVHRRVIARQRSPSSLDTAQRPCLSTDLSCRTAKAPHSRAARV